MIHKPATMNNQQLLSLFSNVLDENSLLSNAQQKRIYETDWRKRFASECLAVLKPSSTKQIQDILTICNTHNVAIVPQGGNTSLCGGAVPVSNLNKRQVILSMTKMNNISAINTTNNTMTAEAGVTLATASACALEHGRDLPLRIASSRHCQIGGLIATNAGGIHAIKYGTMRNLVLGLEVILSDGTILNNMQALYKNNLNFDINQLFIGSEGTLGIITQASLRLFTAPVRRISVLAGVNNIAQAINLLNNLKTHYGHCVAAFEIINDATQAIYNKHFAGTALPIRHKTWLVLFELEFFVDDGYAKEHIYNLASRSGINANSSDELIIADNQSSYEPLWQIRERIPLAEKMNGLGIKHDIALPIDKIESFIATNSRRLREYLGKAQAHFVVFGHLGDGNLHYNVQFDHHDAGLINQHEAAINALVYEDVAHHGGTFSAEHGIGQLKNSWYQATHPTNYQISLGVKQLLDKNNLLNPGKIFSTRHCDDT